MRKLLLILLVGIQTSLMSQEILYHMPSEDELHEGTWIKWPSNFDLGDTNQEELEHIWVEMTRALVTGENVHIIAKDEKEKEHIINVLTDENVALDKVDFYIYPIFNIWARDYGPVFAYDNKNNLVITDWGFNGWGNKSEEGLSDKIPEFISKDLDIPRVDLSSMINEGGSIEVDGKGAMLACRSSILNSNRNPGMTQIEAEEYFRKYLGITHFIWLDGTPGLDITDCHVDGIVKFRDSTTIVTMDSLGLLDYGATEDDINTLFNAEDRYGNPYKFIILPLTDKNVVTSYGKNVGYKGSYINYYTGNNVVLVPNYNDPADLIANQLIQEMYPGRKVVGIDCRDLIINGGMIHCVTQQQPAERKFVKVENKIDEDLIDDFNLEQNYPNPLNPATNISFSIPQRSRVKIIIYDSLGIQVQKMVDEYYAEGNYEIKFDGSKLASGVYYYSLICDKFIRTKKMILLK